MTATIPQPPPANQLVKVFTDDGDFGTESLHAEPVAGTSPQQYRLWNIPAVDHCLNYLDCVYAEPADYGTQMMTRKVVAIAQRGGQRTFRFGTDEPSIVRSLLDTIVPRRLEVPGRTKGVPKDAMVKGIVATLRETLGATVSQAHQSFWLVSVPVENKDDTERLMIDALNHEAIVYFSHTGVHDRFGPYHPATLFPPKVRTW